jgi:hypothetical protein
MKTHAVVPAAFSQQLQVIDAIGIISKDIESTGSRSKNEMSLRHRISYGDGSENLSIL